METFKQDPDKKDKSNVQHLYIAGMKAIEY
jgi:hypothetical protein